MEEVTAELPILTLSFTRKQRQIIIGSVYGWFLFFFSSRRRHTRFDCDWSSGVCSSDLADRAGSGPRTARAPVAAGKPRAGAAWRDGRHRPWGRRIARIERHRAGEIPPRDRKSVV